MIYLTLNNTTLFSPFTVKYMIDLDLVGKLPNLHNDFQSNFKLPGILPGGLHCMMNAVG